MKWSLCDSLILVSMTISISILASNTEAAEFTFKDIPYEGKLPVWLSFIHPNLTANKQHADTRANALMLEIRQSLRSSDENEKHFRSEIARKRFEHAFENNRSRVIPDGVALLVGTAVSANQCERRSYLIGSMTGSEDIKSPEEIIMVWTMLRVMAHYMFYSHQQFQAFINATDDTPVLEMNFDLPDATVIPNYYLMSSVDKDIQTGTCNQAQRTN